MGRLRSVRPEDSVLSEEARGDEATDLTRLTADRVWIIDPLDGTREYGEGRSDWAVHVALWERGQLTAGAVALPGRTMTLGTGHPASVAPPPEVLRVVVSRTRPPKEALAIAEALGADLVEMGSAGAKAMAVVLRRGRSLSALRRTVRVGLGCSGGGGRRGGSPLLTPRRQPTGLQPGGPLPPGPPDLSTRACRGGDRGRRRVRLRHDRDRHAGTRPVPHRQQLVRPASAGSRLERHGGVHVHRSRTLGRRTRPTDLDARDRRPAPHHQTPGPAPDGQATTAASRTTGRRVLAPRYGCQRMGAA